LGTGTPRHSSMSSMVMASFILPNGEMGCVCMVDSGGRAWLSMTQFMPSTNAWQAATLCV
jgi:hypothetical protein